MWGSGTRILRFNQKDYQETNQQLKGVVASTVPPEYTSSEPSSRKPSEQVPRDYTSSDMAASQRVTNGFGSSGHCTAWRPACGTVSLLYPQSPKRQAGGVPVFQKVSTQKRFTRARPPARHQKMMTQSKMPGRRTGLSPSKMEEAATIHPFLGKKARGQSALRLTHPPQAPPRSAT